jgi:hypothetical protein
MVLKSRVESYYQALDELTLEVSKARLKYPSIEFWRWLYIPEGFPKEKIKNWSSIDQVEKAEIIKTGNENRKTSVHLFELYKSGSWDISNFPPGYQEYEIY